MMQLLSSILLPLCAIEGHADLQVESVLHLTGAADQEFPLQYLRLNEFISSRDTFENICKWRGFECVDGSLVKMHGYWSDSGLAWNLSWFPSSLTVIKISFLNMDTLLPTRFLPKKLETCILDSCDLRGSIDLRTLPYPLIRLSVPGNSLSGKVFLTSLPPKITEVNLLRNKIGKVFISMEDIPESFHVSVLNQGYNEKPRIVYVGSVCKNRPNFVF
uniref:Leucine-rich repeat-containing N-terminal plant-type domain-containing protein n=1 Tax=Paramoeba aestuarina TaxID=180227 RepID=A0A7S4PEF3_9EUKA|mmetsp:Transcript_4857/g.7254  ORF Transcript_4857/g.7254 Transcript_4857/m.7254 type:complete len:217 (+) Transcript_4857:39-689(+)